ncbi:MAG: hypothetical protein ACLTAF_02570 [Blautia coccoides]
MEFVTQNPKSKTDETVTPPVNTTMAMNMNYRTADRNHFCSRQW